jgi:hypothetical protein
MRRATLLNATQRNLQAVLKTIDRMPRPAAAHRPRGPHGVGGPVFDPAMNDSTNSFTSGSNSVGPASAREPRTFAIERGRAGRIFHRGCSVTPLPRITPAAVIPCPAAEPVRYSAFLPRRR